MSEIPADVGWFERVQRIQGLNGEIMAELAALEGLPGRLAELRSKLATLMEYYEAQWSGDVEAMEASEDLYARHQESLPEGTYSILAQDPIYDTIREFSLFSKATRKAVKFR